MKKLIFLGIIVSAASAHGQTTIYNTFGPGDSYDTLGSWTVSSAQSVATAFTVSSASNLSSISLVLSAGTNYTVSLTTDGSGQPGTVLDSWSVAGTSAKQTLTPNFTDTLSAGTYYVEAQSSGAGAWSLNSIGYSDTFLYTSEGNWYPFTGTTSVLQVQTTPEPASMAAVGFGIVGLAIRRRRRR